MLKLEVILVALRLMVILAGLHHGDGAGRGRSGPLIWHDWSTGIQGLDFGECSSVGAVVVAEKARAREQAERRRLFYVGMTRARERLVLSGALSKRPVRGALLELLEEAAGTELDDGRQAYGVCEYSIHPARGRWLS